MSFHWCRRTEPGRNTEPVIEPCQAAEQVILGAIREGLPHDVTREVLGVIDVPHITGLELEARGSYVAFKLVLREGSLKIAVRKVDQRGEANAVLDRHAGALGHRLQRRMRGVANERNAALVPMPDRVTIRKRPAPFEIHHRQHRLYGLLGARKDAFYFGSVIVLREAGSEC